MPPDPANPPGQLGWVEETRMESVEEIRQVLRGEPATVLPPLASRNYQPEPPQMTAQNLAVETDTQPFRPLRRSPLALLCIIDDGRDEGEWVRLRADQIVIGRSDGDILIPHDNLMSGRHAEIVRQLVKGAYSWHLNDLNSTNGTFVRISGSVLRHGHELLIGGRRLRFESAQQGLPAAAPPAPSATTPAPPVKGTSAWQGMTTTDLVPSLVEVHPQGLGQVFPLIQPENWVGSNPRACSVVLSNDPMVSPRHARIYRDSKNRWRVENAGSLNGTWLRIGRQALEGAGQFQLGEQRFLLRVLS
jgi:pSer/pThr/pTyr-binding forkhead associated (FHA) protein